MLEYDKKDINEGIEGIIKNTCVMIVKICL